MSPGLFVVPSTHPVDDPGAPLLDKHIMCPADPPPSPTLPISYKNKILPPKNDPLHEKKPLWRQTAHRPAVSVCASRLALGHRRKKYKTRMMSLTAGKTTK